MDILTFSCPNCGSGLKAEMVVHYGGVNEYGWWIIKCGSCDHFFSEYVGRDVRDSSLSEGGEIVVRLDRDRVSEEEVEQKVQAFRWGSLGKPGSPN